MEEIGYKERYLKFLKNRKLFAILTIVSISLFLIDAILFVIFVTYENFNKAYFINLGICIAISLFFVFSFLTTIYYKNELKFIKYLFSKYVDLINGKVVEISEELMVVRNRKAISVIVEENNIKLTTYLDASFDAIPFKVGDDVLLKTSDSFILEFEVKEK